MCFLKNPVFLKQLIVDYLHLDFKIDNFEIKNSEQFIDNLFEKRKVLDIYVLINKTKHVSIELNNCDFNTVKKRNIMYANKIYNTFLKSGEDLSEINKHYLYQLNLNVCNKKEPDTRNIRICDLETKELIAENYEIVTINLGKIDKTGYNKTKENEWNIIINSHSYEEMENSLKRIFKEDEIIKQFLEVVRNMEKDEVLLNDWDANVLNEKIIKAEKEYAKEQAKEKTEKLLIENMFKNGIDISLISKITSVPIKQLQKIKTTLFL